jgi:predicted permease
VGRGGGGVQAVLFDVFFFCAVLRSPRRHVIELMDGFLNILHATLTSRHLLAPCQRQKKKKKITPQQKTSWSQRAFKIARNVALNPVFFMVMLGLLFNAIFRLRFGVPRLAVAVPFVDSVLVQIGCAFAPCALFSLGLSIIGLKGGGGECEGGCCFLSSRGGGSV